MIDVGGGASTLVDVLDVSSAALAKSRLRLGEKARGVEWIVADATTVEDLGVFDVWHDRAVFHFLTDPHDRRRYVDLAARTLPAGGRLIIATFAEDGPTRSSRLDVRRYDADSLSAVLGRSFELVREDRESHETPSGTLQSFFYGVFRKL